MTIACTMAALLLWAAMEKARNPAPTAASIRALGLPAAKPISLILIAAEVFVALALLFRPGSAVAQGGVVALAASFAAAGLRALTLHHPVKCYCFGAGGSGHLGKAQAIAFLPWLAGATILRI